MGYYEPFESAETQKLALPLNQQQAREHRRLVS